MAHTNTLEVYNGFHFDSDEQHRTVEEIPTKCEDIAIGEVMKHTNDSCLTEENRNKGKRSRTFSLQ